MDLFKDQIGESLNYNLSIKSFRLETQILKNSF